MAPKILPRESSRNLQATNVGEEEQSREACEMDRRARNERGSSANKPPVPSKDTDLDEEAMPWESAASNPPVPSKDADLDEEEVPETTFTQEGKYDVTKSLKACLKNLHCRLCALEILD